jgi:pimeloyl-ACP methyl ester carboxylesterase
MSVSDFQTVPFPSEEKSTNDRSVKLPIPTFLRLPYQALDLLSPKLAGELGRRLFFRPARLYYTDMQRQVLDLAEERYLGRVATYCWGDASGPTVLLIHGWGGHAGQMTEFVEPLTAQGFRVVAIDMPAHGKSDGKLSSVVHFSTAIRQAARYFGRVHGVITHSLGGGGLVHALLNGLSAKRVVLIAPQSQFHDYWRMFRNGLGMSDKAWKHMVEISEDWLGVPFAEIHPGVGAPRMTAPALILHGTRDKLSPVKEGHEMARLWPDARLEEFDTGHSSILREPAAIRAAAAFIQS